jgi:hypothetical protein
MNPQLLLSIIELAVSVIKSQTSTNVADKIDEATAIGRIVLAGRQAYQNQVGKPLDESLIKPEPPLT